jgi:hypothetical protein
MTDDHNYECNRPSCDASFYTKTAQEFHIVHEHDELRDEVDNYPRAPHDR